MLCLSRARRYGARNSNPSDLLTAIARQLPNNPNDPVTWPSSTRDSTAIADPTPTNEPYLAEDLDLYLRCPRQYFYESILRLNRGREDSGYVKFHRCVYRVLRWMGRRRASGQPADEAAAIAHLTKVWDEQGPHGHVFEELYRSSAVDMVLRTARRSFTSRDSKTQPQWEVSIRLGRIRFTPDHVEVLNDGSEIVERLRTGRQTKNEKNKDILALYVVAAQEAVPRVLRSVQVRYLATDQVEPVVLSPRQIETRLGHYNDAIRGILLGDYSPTPNDRICPRCPHYFICPSGEDA